MWEGQAELLQFEGADSCGGRITGRRVAALDRTCQTLVGYRKEVVRDGVESRVPFAPAEALEARFGVLELWRCSLSVSRRRRYVSWSDTWSASWEVAYVWIIWFGACSSIRSHAAGAAGCHAASASPDLASRCRLLKVEVDFINGLIGASRDGSGLHVPAEADHCSSAE